VKSREENELVHPTPTY